MHYINLKSNEVALQLINEHNQQLPRVELFYLNLIV